MSRILIIEDDRAILRGLKDNLEYESYEVLTATDGEEGYGLIRSGILKVRLLLMADICLLWTGIRVISLIER